MTLRRKHTTLPAVICAGSFLCILLLAVLTSPVSAISYAITFFVILLIFLVSTGYCVVIMQNGQIRPKDRYRIFIISLLILVAIMLRSAQSLNLIDAITLLLVGIGLLIYSGRRSN